MFGISVMTVANSQMNRLTASGSVISQRSEIWWTRISPVGTNWVNGSGGSMSFVVLPKRARRRGAFSEWLWQLLSVQSPGHAHYHVRGCALRDVKEEYVPQPPALSCRALQPRDESAPHTCKQVRRHGRSWRSISGTAPNLLRTSQVEPVAAARETVVGSYHAHLMICYRTSKHYS